MPPHVEDRWRDYLGPGALATLVVALASAVLGLGLPILWRLREVLAHSERDDRRLADAILVLGRTLVADLPTDVFAGRLAHGAHLWREGVAPRVLVAGGLTGRATRTEAAAGREHLIGLGLPPEAVLVEDRSRHTLENLFHVRETLRQEGWREVVVVSDPLHLARVVAMAKGLRLTCSPSGAGAAAPAHRVSWWLRATREAWLLHWYHTGVVFSRLVGRRDWLARVR